MQSACGQGDEAQQGRADVLQLLMDANARSGAGKISAEELTAGDDADKFEERREQESQGKDASKDIKLTDEEVVQNAWIVMLAGYANSIAAYRSQT